MGNSHVDEIRYPAGYQSVIAVGATNALDEIASFSTTGNHMSVCAPGVEIYSTVPGGGYDYKSGTSMSCPFAAGAAALLLSDDFTLSPYEIKTRLEESAVDLGMTGFDSIYGNGRVDINAALNNAEASDYGKIDVSIKDRLGTVVSGASVILWEDGSAISTTNSNEDGHAIFEYIHAGDYQVSVSLPPYNSALAENNPITLAAGSIESINISFDTAVVPDVHANSNIGHSVPPLFQEAEFTNENFVSTLKEKIVTNINKEKFNKSNGLYYEICIWWDQYDG
jgi:subtilisin family serine protease